MSRRARQRSRDLKRWPQRRWSWLFRATGYSCRLGELRVGRRSSWLDRWLAEVGCKRWIWVTADNPGVELHGRDVNAAAQERLLRWLVAMDVEALPMTATADAGDWPAEHGYLCCGMSMKLGRDIGRHFGQAAVLAGKQKGRVRLIWLAGS